MYFTERAIGVATYALLLAIAVFRICRNTSNKKRVLFAYLVALCLIGALFVPASGNDLFRIREIMHSNARLSYSQLIQKARSSTTPIALLYYGVVGKIGIDGLLPAITVAITYGNIFYVFYKYCKRTELNGIAVGCALLLLMCNSSFFETISGIRTMLCFSIVLRCMYAETFESKSFIKHIVLYIIACLIHSIGVVLLAIRMIAYLLNLFRSPTAKNLLLIVSLFVLCGVLFYYGKPYLFATVDKAESYLNEGTYSYLWENILSSLITTLLVCIQVSHYRCIKGSEAFESFREYYLFLLMVDLCTVLFITEHNIFFRFTNFNLMASIPVYLDYLGRKEKRTLLSFSILFVLFLGLSCIRGNLSSLKFFEI